MSTDTFDEQVAVIVGSTRPTRICPGIDEWTQRTLSERSPLRYRSIDLAEITLPMLDEPLKAALQDYKHARTKAWSNLIGSFAGFRRAS
jgi:NAD(P)H-dependent FMN reductase